MSRRLDAPEFTSDRVSGRTAARGAEPAKPSPAHLSPSEAQFRYGPRHEAGVILVTLK